MTMFLIGLATGLFAGLVMSITVLMMLKENK